MKYASGLVSARQAMPREWILVARLESGNLFELSTFYFWIYVGVCESTTTLQRSAIMIRIVRYTHTSGCTLLQAPSQ